MPVARLRHRTLALLAVPLLGSWLVLAAGAAHAAVSTAPIVIDFDRDPVGVALPLPFTSADSPAVHFDVVDYSGSGPCNATTCPRPAGAHLNVTGYNSSFALIADGGPPNVDPLAVHRLTFNKPTQNLRLTLDYDMSLVSEYRAVLTGFRGGQPVATAAVPISPTQPRVETITLQGYVIDSAVVQLDLLGVPGLPFDPLGFGSRVYVVDVHSDPLCSRAGGSGKDTITGTTGIDVICGGPGDDTLMGAGGNDLIFGDQGNDKVFGGPGNDTLNGGAGTDACDGGTGTDSAVQCEKRTTIP
jgi:hypothetical protein